MNDLAAAALGYAARGWPVLPLHAWTGDQCTCGDSTCASPAKHPRTRNGLKDATTTPETITSWWGRWPDANIGLRTGVAFDVLDVDGDEGFASMQRMEEAHGIEPVGPTSYTGGGGAHRLYLPTGIGNRAGIIDHVDWRGQNGYIVAPPSNHASGGHYEWDADQSCDAPLEEVTGWLHDLLFPPRVERPTIPMSSIRPAGRSEYGRRAFVAELEELSHAGQGTRNHTLNACAFNLYQLVAGGELLETEVTGALTQTALSIGLTQRETDMTIGSAKTAGMAQPRWAPALRIIDGTSALNIDITVPITAVDGEQEVTEPTTWEPVDVAAVLASGCHIPAPTLYQRSDGVSLLYAGKLHAFNGEPESGKSWAAQHAAAQAIGQGLHVCYIDFEDSPESVIGRLLALGATPDDLTEYLTYIGPERPLNEEAVLILRATFTERRPALVVIDGVTEAMSIMGLDPLDNADTAKFFRILPRRLAKLDAAVVMVDHVVKDKDNRGRWAIGSQHKMAALTGAAYTVEVVKAFGRNRAGMSRIIVTKDRPGYIRQHAADGTVAELHLVSNDTAVTAELRTPNLGQGFRPTHMMARISDVLSHGPALTKNALRRAVGGDHDTFILAVELLVAEGYVSAERQGQSIYHASTRAFIEEREDDERF